MTRPQLVSHWRVLWRAWSTRFMAIALALPAIVETMPQNIRVWSENHLPLLMWAVTSLGLTSRYVKQFDLGSYVSTTQEAPPASQTKREQVMSENVSAASAVKSRIEAGFLAVAEDAASALPAPVGPTIKDLIAACKSGSAADIIKVIEDIATALDAHGAVAVNNAIASGAVVVPLAPQA